MNVNAGSTPAEQDSPLARLKQAAQRFTEIDPEVRRRALLSSTVDRSSAEAPAPAQPCASCPWVVENAGREHPDGWFDETAKARYWNNVRTGKAFRCHTTYMPEPFVSNEAAADGWRPTPEHSVSKECAGGVALMKREQELRERLGSAEAYFDTRGPYGVTEAGFALLRARESGQVAPAVRHSPDVVEQIDVAWIPWPVADSEPALIVPPCDCPVCARHEEAHDQVQLVDAAGAVVEVDRPLAPLVVWLWDQGASTVGSCQSMSEAVDRLWPRKRQMILDPDSTAPEHMNYRTILEHDLAFVRGVRHPAWDRLIAVVTEVCEKHEIAQWGAGIHVAFPLSDLDEIMGRL